MAAPASRPIAPGPRFDHRPAVVIGLRTIGLALAMAPGFASWGSAAEPPKPPATTFPQLEDRIAAQTYERRLAEHSDALKTVREEARGDWPTTGAVLQSVAAESPAEELGMKAGDILMRFDEFVIWTTRPWPRSMVVEQKCEFFSPQTRRRRTVTVPPGMIGINTANFWRPELAYLRGKSADPKWDADAVLGIATAASDPDLSETAWNHCIANGHKPGGAAIGSGIARSFARGDADAAWRFASLGRDKDGSELHPILQFRAAVANHQLQEMLRLAGKYPQAFFMSADDMRAMIRADEGRPAAERNAAPPHVLAERMYRDDIVPRLVAQRQSTAVHALKSLKNGTPLEMNQDPAFHQENVVSAPGAVGDFDMSIKFSWKPSPGDGMGYLKQFALTVIDGVSDPVDVMSPMAMKPALFGLSLNEGSMWLLLGADRQGVQFVDDSPKFQPGEHTVRFIRVGGRGEIFLNGCRLADVPVDPAIRLPWLELKSVGAQATIKELRFVELIEKR